MNSNFIRTPDTSAIDCSADYCDSGTLFAALGSRFHVRQHSRTFPKWPQTGTPRTSRFNRWEILRAVSAVLRPESGKLMDESAGRSIADTAISSKPLARHLGPMGVEC